MMKIKRRTLIGLCLSLLGMALSEAQTDDGSFVTVEYDDGDNSIVATRYRPLPLPVEDAKIAYFNGSVSCQQIRSLCISQDDTRAGELDKHPECFV